MLTPHTRLPKPVYAMATTPTKKALPAIAQPINTTQTPATPSVDHFKKINAVHRSIPASVRSGKVFQFPLASVHLEKLITSLPTSINTQHLLVEGSQPTEEQSGSILQVIERYLDKKVLDPLKRGELLPNGISKQHPALMEIEIKNNNGIPVVEYHVLLVKPLPLPDLDSLALAPHHLQAMEHLGVEVEIIETLEENMAFFIELIQSKAINNQVFLNKGEDYDHILGKLFEPLINRVSQKVETLNPVDLENFITQSMTTKIDQGGGIYRYCPPIKMSNALRDLGLYGKVRANRKHFQETLDKAIQDALADILVPAEGGQSPLIIMELPIKSSPQMDNFSPTIPTLFSDFILND